MPARRIARWHPERVGSGLANCRSNTSVTQATGVGKRATPSSEKVVPITRDNERYLEPRSLATKRKITFRGTELGRYRHRGDRARRPSCQIGRTGSTSSKVVRPT